MSTRCTITMIGPVHIWEDAIDGEIHVEAISARGYIIDKYELVNAVNNLLVYLGQTHMQTHSGDENE